MESLTKLIKKPWFLGSLVVIFVTVIFWNIPMEKRKYGLSQSGLVTDYTGLLPVHIERVIKAENRNELQNIIKQANVNGHEISIAGLQHSHESLPYIVLLLQVILGLLQGYFRAWHAEQETYHLHAVHHYLIVGFMMIGFSFVKIISPVVFIMIFGFLMCMCGVWELFRKGKKDENINVK